MCFLCEVGAGLSGDPALAVPTPRPFLYQVDRLNSPFSQGRGLSSSRARAPRRCDGSTDRGARIFPSQPLLATDRFIRYSGRAGISFSFAYRPIGLVLSAYSAHLVRGWRGELCAGTQNCRARLVSASPPFAGAGRAAVSTLNGLVSAARRAAAGLHSLRSVPESLLDEVLRAGVRAARPALSAFTAASAAAA